MASGEAGTYGVCVGQLKGHLAVGCGQTTRWLRKGGLDAQMGKGVKAAGPVGRPDRRGHLTQGRGITTSLVNESHLAEGGRVIGQVT